MPLPVQQAGTGQGALLKLTQALKAEALRLGFSAVGIASPDALARRSDKLSRWLLSGFAGGLGYMEQFFERQERFLRQLPDLKSIVVLLVPYGPSAGQTAQPSKPSGQIARYAWGRDYHRAIRKRLKALEAYLRNQDRKELRTAASVDTSAVPEKALAEAAGLGFFGKNSCLIRPKGGSYFFVAALLTNQELVPDQPIRWDCGSCTLCLQACPTQALVNPYELDARRCISYLTIEHRGAIDPALRPFMGEWLFGCDICQEVCPYNQSSLRVRQGSPQNLASPPSSVAGTLADEAIPWPEFQAKAGAGGTLPLTEVLGLRSEEAFLKRFAGTPLMRAKREGLVRNAAVAAGNLKDPALVPALREALKEDPSPIVREHAAWALKSNSNRFNV